MFLSRKVLAGVPVGPLEVEYIGGVSRSTSLTSGNTQNWGSTTIGTRAGQPGRKILLGLCFNYDNADGNNWPDADLTVTLGGETFGPADTTVLDRQAGYIVLSSGPTGDREMIVFAEFGATGFANSEALSITAGARTIYYCHIFIIETLNVDWYSSAQDTDSSVSTDTFGTTNTLSNLETDFIVALFSNFHDSASFPSHSGTTLQSNVSLANDSPNTWSHYGLGFNASPTANLTVSQTPFSGSRSAQIVLVGQRS